MDFTAHLGNTLYNRALALVVAWAGLAVVGLSGIASAHVG
ncbi:MAG: hypothetical protein JWL78_679 [Chloroflexi bacterium]|jgi:hypothetical protein|nr:hypothetical protein [Chloroflexota bacterium]MEA2616189.1 hypothetical protein [Chloroflexota bacterium]